MSVIPAARTPPTGSGKTRRSMTSPTVLDYALNAGCRGAFIPMHLNEIPTAGHERVVHAIDPESGLDAVISVHSTVLGPSLGGIRMLPYRSLEEAIIDVNRLSKAMTYKHAIAETGQGGGKAVIIGDPTEKSEALFLAMGRVVQALDGVYIAAEDMNINVTDLEIVSRETRWVSGLSREHGSSGNPSPMTALGCFHAISTCLARVFANASLEGRTIAILGVGAVGSALAVMCGDAGAKVLIADLDGAKAEALAVRHKLRWIEDPDEMARMPCDVFAPCGRGGILNATSIPQLKCKIIAGAANNQLAEAQDAQRLHERGILYAPDYVVNAGGVINIAAEFEPGGYSSEHALERCRTAIPRALDTIFGIANAEGITTAAAADRLAETRLAAGRK